MAAVAVYGDSTEVTRQPMNEACRFILKSQYYPRSNSPLAQRTPLIKRLLPASRCSRRLSNAFVAFRWRPQHSPTGGGSLLASHHVHALRSAVADPLTVLWQMRWRHHCPTTSRSQALWHQARTAHHSRLEAKVPIKASPTHMAATHYR